MREQPEALSMDERMEAMRDFIARDPDFVCGWGRKSLLAGTLTMRPYKQAKDFMQGTETIKRALEDGFAEGTKDACVLVHESDCSSHIMEYMRAMAMYAQTRTAAGIIEGASDHRALAQESAALARKIFLEEIDRFIENYTTFGKIRFQGDHLMVLGSSPLYPEKHGRKSPATSWVITRMRDGGDARRANPVAAQTALLKAWEGATIPYGPAIPYVLPNDPRFAMPSFRKWLEAAPKLLEPMREFFTATPLEFAIVMVRYQARHLVLNASGKLALDSAMNLDTMLNAFCEAGFLDPKVKP